MMYNSNITKRKRQKKGKNKMIEREWWNKYYYTNNHIYCHDCWEYNDKKYFEYVENKQNISYEIEEIVNDFLNN